MKRLNQTTHSIAAPETSQAEAAGTPVQPSGRISPRVSRLITLMRFPQIVLVVLRHNAGPLLDAVYGCGVLTASGVLVTGLGGIFAYSALLLMFFLSGFLFWHREQPYGVMLKKKVRVLLFPYLIWNTVVIVFYFIGAQTGILQNLSSYIQPDVRFPAVLFRLYTGWGAGGYPAAYPLWYMRDLMLIMLASPLLSFCMKNFPRLSLTVLFLLWAFGSNPFFSVEGLLLFCLGRYAVKLDGGWIFLDRIKPLPLTAVCLLTMGIEIAGFLNGRLLLHKFNVLAGSLVFLKLCSLLPACPRAAALLTRLSVYSFCIYLFHEPLLSVIRTLAVSLRGSYTIPLYLFTSALAILICMASGALLQKLLPVLYRILSGGR